MYFYPRKYYNKKYKYEQLLDTYYYIIYIYSQW